jgi:hypothetical protein
MPADRPPGGGTGRLRGVSAAAVIAVVAALVIGIVLAAGGGGSAASASGGPSRGLNPDGFALPATAAPGRPSLTGACHWQYPGHPGAVAEHVARSSPITGDTVQCLDGTADLGGLYLSGYCDQLVSGMVAGNPDRNGPASGSPPPWDQWECIPG